MENDLSSLNLDEDLKELAIFSPLQDPSDANNNAFLNQNSFPQDLSFENGIEKKAHSLLDSQNELNKAIIYQNSTEKIAFSRKEIENKRLLSDILEDGGDFEKKPDNVLQMEGELKHGNFCGCFEENKDGSGCLLI